MTKRQFNFFLILAVLFGSLVYLTYFSQRPTQHPTEVKGEKVTEKAHWLVLHRKSNVELLYHGVPGDASQSELVRTFQVKTGISGERPTPLPELVGREYWLITAKEEQADNPETAPYFLTLDIPAPSVEPYGPTPYTECAGSEFAGPDGQCHWVLPGAFGLHGSAGNPYKLSIDDPGSSGCIRHYDEDITYLYQTLNPQEEEIRYYIEDK